MRNMTAEEAKMFAEFVRSEMSHGEAVVRDLAESPTMSTPINDGGTAFPVPDSHYPSGAVQYGTNGMSLRAYIAAKALPALIGLMTPADAAEYKPADLQAATARAACGYADALLAELGKEGK